MPKAREKLYKHADHTIRFRHYHKTEPGTAIVIITGPLLNYSAIWDLNETTDTVLDKVRRAIRKGEAHE